MCGQIPETTLYSRSTAPGGRSRARHCCIRDSDGRRDKLARRRAPRKRATAEPSPQAAVRPAEHPVGPESSPRGGSATGQEEPNRARRPILDWRARIGRRSRPSLRDGPKHPWTDFRTRRASAGSDATAARATPSHPPDRISYGLDTLMSACFFPEGSCRTFRFDLERR